MAAIGAGIDAELLTKERDLQNVAPPGFEGGLRNGKFSHRKEGTDLPDSITDDFESAEHSEVALAMCYARAGYLLKTLAYCETVGVNALTNNNGLAKLISLINRDYLVAAQKVHEYTGEDISRGLYALENLVFREYIDKEVLDNASPEQILKLRTKAWGKAHERKAELKEVLIEIVQENEGDKKVESAINREIKAYLKECRDLEHENWKLHMRVLLGAGSYVTAGGLASSDELINMSNNISLITIGTIGLSLLLRDGKTIVPQIMDLIKRKGEVRALRGYALFHPYENLKNG